MKAAGKRTSIDAGLTQRDQTHKASDPASKVQKVSKSDLPQELHAKVEGCVRAALKNRESTPKRSLEAITLQLVRELTQGQLQKLLAYYTGCSGACSLRAPHRARPAARMGRDRRYQCWGRVKQRKLRAFRRSLAAPLTWPRPPATPPPAETPAKHLLLQTFCAALAKHTEQLTAYRGQPQPQACNQDTTSVQQLALPAAYAPKGSEKLLPVATQRLVVQAGQPRALGARLALPALQLPATGLWHCQQEQQ